MLLFGRYNINNQLRLYRTAALFKRKGENMKELAYKTNFKIIIIFEFIVGILCFALIALVTGLVIWYASLGAFAELESVPTAIAILAVFYLLCLIGGLWFTQRFVMWKKQPQALISVDGENIYFYAKGKMNSAPLSQIEYIFAMPETLFVHLFGGGYGIVKITISGKTYKVYFVDGANKVPAAIEACLKKD